MHLNRFGAMRSAPPVLGRTCSILSPLSSARRLVSFVALGVGRWPGALGPPLPSPPSSSPRLSGAGRRPSRLLLLRLLVCAVDLRRSCACVHLSPLGALFPAPAVPLVRCTLPRCRWRATCTFSRGACRIRPRAVVQFLPSASCSPVGAQAPLPGCAPRCVPGSRHLGLSRGHVLWAARGRSVGDGWALVS